MKTIGLIGGMSWESTSEYYRMINQEVNKRLGRLNSAKIILYSVNFDEIERNMAKERWDETGKVLSQAAAKLMSAGANCVLLCTNTMHMNAKDITSAVSIPFIHIADATADAIKKAGFKKAAFLGTRITMEENFIKDIFTKNRIKLLIPTKEDRDFIHDAIFKELVKGVIKDETRDMVLQILDTLYEQGAECAILGCTELGIIIKQGDAPMPLFDTTYCHAMAAVDFALKK